MDLPAWYFNICFGVLVLIAFLSYRND